MGVHRGSTAPPPPPSPPLKGEGRQATALGGWGELTESKNPLSCKPRDFAFAKRLGQVRGLLSPPQGGRGPTESLTVREPSPPLWGRKDFRDVGEATSLLEIQERGFLLSVIRQARAPAAQY